MKSICHSTKSIFSLAKTPKSLIATPGPTGTGTKISHRHPRQRAT